MQTLVRLYAEEDTPSRASKVLGILCTEEVFTQLSFGDRIRALKVLLADACAENVCKGVRETFLDSFLDFWPSNLCKCSMRVTR